MTIEQLIFVGLNGYAVALDRNTGEIVWSNDELKSGPVTLLLDGDRLIVSTGGYLFCLDPLTGKVPLEQRNEGLRPGGANGPSVRAWARPAAGGATRRGSGCNDDGDRRRSRRCRHFLLVTG